MVIYKNEKNQKLLPYLDSSQRDNNYKDYKGEQNKIFTKIHKI
jgi:hypothetical protein